MTLAIPEFKIVFVPGLRAKPETSIHRKALVRCIDASLGRVSKEAQGLFRAHESRFVIYPWTHEFYGQYRDFELDRAGVDALLANPIPSTAQKADIDAIRRRIFQLSYRAGDRVPLLGRMLATRNHRKLLSEARRYLRNRNGVADRTRAGLRAVLKRVWRPQCRLIIIGHSFGSVISYETLWEISRTTDLEIDTFLTIGSPIGTHFVGKLLLGQNGAPEDRYPSNIRRWVNFSARGELTALYPRLRPKFEPMIKNGLLESLEDRVDLYNPFYGSNGLNVHAEYGYLLNTAFAESLASAMLNPAVAQS